MIPGAITNSWRLQLAERDLADLIEEARSRGARHVELRQTCLGDCESGEGDDWRPELSRLKAVVDAFPDMTFDLAMAYPCLTREAEPMGEQFQAALEAARIVGRDVPHLRMVDPNADAEPWERAADLPAAALGLAELGREAARQGVILSVENSGQPLRSMALLTGEARARLSPEEGSYIGLCPDPTNQLRRHPDSDPLAELEALPLDMVKIVHFKQARNGAAHSSVDTGDLDCLKMQEILERKGYRGAAVMEIPPHQQVFDNLEASFAYLDAS